MQFVDVKEAFGKHAGESYNWLKVNDIGTYGGVLVETNTMHEANQSMVWGTGSVDEYGNSIPFTFKAESLSQFDVNEILRSGLVDDMSKVIDGLCEREFRSTNFKMVGTASGAYAFSTDGTHTGINTSGLLTAYHIRKAVLELKKKNVPGYTKLGGAYAGIINVAHSEQLEEDLIDNKSVQNNTSGYQEVLLNGEVGKISGMRLIEDNFATQFHYDPTARTATSKASDGPGGNVTVGKYIQVASHAANANGADAYFFGSPTVREAIVVPEEIRKKIPTDYGRSKGIAWYWLGGFRLEWGYETDDQANARIIHWSSQ